MWQRLGSLTHIEQAITHKQRSCSFFWGKLVETGIILQRLGIIAKRKESVGFVEQSLLIVGVDSNRIFARRYRIVYTVAHKLCRGKRVPITARVRVLVKKFLEYLFALLVIAMGKCYACLNLTIVHKIGLVRTFKPFCRLIRLTIINKQHCYVENIVGHIVFIDTLQVGAQETVGSINILLGYHNLCLQIKAVKVELVDNHVYIMTCRLYIVLVYQSHTSSKNKRHCCTWMQAYSIVENADSLAYSTFLIIELGNVCQLFRFKILLLFHLYRLFVTLEYLAKFFAVEISFFVVH